jgi:serine/threonine protein kinase
MLTEFLGANVLDDKPFIVMPFLKNGNARQYMQAHPSCDRLVLVNLYVLCPSIDRNRHILKLYDISLGLVYLHSKKVVHGDLKAVILIYFWFYNSLLPCINYLIS